MIRRRQSLVDEETVVEKKELHLDVLSDQDEADENK
jgi:hypothetical protein